MITISHTCKRCEVVTAIDEDEYDNVKYHKDDLCEKCRIEYKKFRGDLEEEMNQRKKEFFRGKEE